MEQDSSPVSPLQSPEDAESLLIAVLDTFEEFLRARTPLAARSLIRAVLMTAQWAIAREGDPRSDRRIGLATKLEEEYLELKLSAWLDSDFSPLHPDDAEQFTRDLSVFVAGCRAAVRDRDAAWRIYYEWEFNHHTVLSIIDSLWTLGEL